MPTKQNLPKLVVALDVPTAAEAENLVAQLASVHPQLGFKVGMELFYGEGLSFVQKLQSQVVTPIFVDVKLHDIPNTVERTAAQLVRHGVRWFNLHTTGSKAMMLAALEGATRALPGGESTDNLTILGVTLLTSLNQAVVAEELRMRGTMEAIVTQLAQQAQQTGLHGVVCSAKEAGLIQAACGEDFARITPGIRLLDDAVGDQQRVLTPQAALEKGATTLVVGRPITQATDPIAAAQAFMAAVDAADSVVAQ